MNLQLTTTEMAAPKTKAKCGAGAGLNAGINAVVRCPVSEFTGVWISRLSPCSVHARRALVYQCWASRDARSDVIESDGSADAPAFNANKALIPVYPCYWPHGFTDRNIPAPDNGHYFEIRTCPAV